MKAMILAAGLGKRLRPLTETTPKPLIKAGGKALLQYHIEKLVDAGISDIVINHAWLGEQIVNFVGDGSRFGCSIQCSAETEPMETAGGIIQALPLLSPLTAAGSESADIAQQSNAATQLFKPEPFLLINGDIWSEIDYGELAGMQLGDDLAHLVLVENPAHNPDGDFYLQQGRVLDKNAVDATKVFQKLTFAGVSLLSPLLFVGLEPGNRPLKPVLDSAICAGKVSGVHSSAWWCDVGTLERLQQLEDYLPGKQ